MSRQLDRRLRRLAATAIAAFATVAVAAPAVAATDVDASLGLMPSDTAVVVGANIDRFRKSALFADVTKMMGGADNQDLLEKLKAAGLDPRSNLDNILVALSVNAKTSEGPLILLPGHGDLAKISTLMKSVGQRKVEPQKYKGVDTLMVGGDTSFAVLGEHLVVGPPKVVKQSVDTTKGGGKGARGGRLAKLIAAADTKKDFWLVVDAGGDLKKALAEPGAPPELKDLRSAHAALDFAKGLGLRVTIDLGNAAAAKKLSEQFKAELAKAGGDPGVAMMGLGPAFQKTRVEAKGSEMRVALDLSQEEVDRIRTMMVAMVGMMQGAQRGAPGMAPPGMAPPGMAPPGMAPAMPPPVPAVPAAPDGQKK